MQTVMRSLRHVSCLSEPTPQVIDLLALDYRR